MPLTFQQIAILAIALLVIGLSFAALFFAVFRIISQLFRWLYKHLWFANMVKSMQVAIQNYWQKHLPRLTRIWVYYSEVWADLLFYGYALVVLVDRIESFSDYAKQNPGNSAFELLEIDMINDIMFYFIFAAFFTLWLYSKAWKYNSDKKDKKDTRDSLNNIVKTLVKLNRNINKLYQKLDKQDKGKGDK